MSRKIKDYILISLKGMAMGAADVVPGVSGGTIAFISGIYEELLASISNINISLLKILKKEGFRAAWKVLNGNFLTALFFGIITSFLSLAKIISWLLESYPIPLWSFFFGLVLASIIYVAKRIQKWNALTILLLIATAVIAYSITILPPMVSEDSSLPFIFFAGAIAICAMILPGISGSFILVLLGAYKPILGALTNKDIPIIFVFLMGALIGLLSFSRILKWLFENFKNATLAALTGFIIGSLNKIWPWKKVLTYRINSKGEEVPFNEISILPISYDGNPQIGWALLLALIGFTAILLLEKLAITSKNSE